MHRARHAFTFAGACVLVMSLVFSAGASTASASPAWSFSNVVSGLKLPRGIAFDGQGALYVAESGLPGAGAQGLTKGAVDKYTLDDGAAMRVWSTPFDAAWMSGGAGKDVIGPTGLSASGRGCSENGDNQDQGNGSGHACQILVIMGLNLHEIPAHQFGHLYALNTRTGAVTERGDIGKQNHKWTFDHSSLFEDFPDSNPYGVTVTHRGATYVVDAGANTVSEVSANGTATVIAYIPNETPVAGLPMRDATPTCATQGPDGALYIGTLDLARNFASIPTQGQSHVYRVDPRSHENIFTAAHVWASGVTAITACAFDDSGNFWATEMFKFNGPGAPFGDVVRIPFRHPTAIQHIGGGHLPFPGGIAQGGDGAMYVTTWSAGTGVAIGAVVRVSNSED